MPTESAAIADGAAIYVGIDDTDTLDHPGTNQLARHLIRAVAPTFHGQLVLRHQLLEDPRVPCTKKNGCAALKFSTTAEADVDVAVAGLTERLRELMLDWIPPRSDPGLAIATAVGPEIVRWGQRAQSELLTQREARELAAAEGVYLEGLAGTQDGVIGALAAIGLMASANDGRVVYLARDSATADEADALDICGPLSVEALRARGIEAVLEGETQQPIESGTIEIAKKIRPNFRAGRIVLFAARVAPDRYEALRVR